MHPATSPDFSFLRDDDVEQLASDYARTSEALRRTSAAPHWAAQADLCRQELVERRLRPRPSDAAVWDAAARELYREGGQTSPCL